MKIARIAVLCSLLLALPAQALSGWSCACAFAADQHTPAGQAPAADMPHHEMAGMADHAAMSEPCDEQVESCNCSDCGAPALMPATTLPAKTAWSSWAHPTCESPPERTDPRALRPPIRV